MKKYTCLFFAVFLIVSSMIFHRNSHAWGPEDQSWREQQQKYRQQTRLAKRIDIYNAFRLYNSGKALLISVDSEEYYARSRIVGSIHLPSDKIARLNVKKMKNKILLLYCR